MSNPLREAAIAMQRFEEDHPGLVMTLDVRPHYVLVRARMGSKWTSRVLTWDLVEDKRCNTLTATVALVANEVLS